MDVKSNHKSLERSKYIKVILVGMIVLIIVVGIIGFYFVSSAQKGLYEEKVTLLEEASSKNALLIETKVNDLLSKMESIALYIEKDSETFNLFKALEVLDEEAGRNEFKRMGIILPSGLAHTTDGFEYDFSDREYFKIAFEGTSNVSDRLVDKIGGDPIQVFATPIYQKGEVIAVLFGTKNTQAMADLLSSESFEGEGYSYIIKSNGDPVVFTENKNSVGYFENLFEEVARTDINKEDMEIFQQSIKEGKDGTVQLWRNGVKRQTSYTKIDINDWYMVSAVPTDVISRASDQLITRLIWISILIVTTIITLAIAAISNYKQNNSKLLNIAYVDSITGYANWNKFRQECRQILDKSTHKNHAIVVFDIDKFKVINDVFGYSKGNELLRYIADCMNEILKENECFGRISTDNFVMLVQYHNKGDIIDKVNAISNKVRDYIKMYHVELSFGIYLIEDRTVEVSSLNDRAYIARNTIKTKRDLTYAFYDESIREKLLKEKEIENDMEYALANKEFLVYLQPKYLLEDETIVSGEALVRWSHPRKGLIPPNDFIPLFEKNGFIKQLDRYMFEQVCSFISDWQKEHQQKFPITISVNLSRAHMDTKGLVEDFVKITRKYGVDPVCLEIELTESAVFKDTDKLIKIMQSFKKEGFFLSIDDFGSGYSSLNTLKDLPVDIIKFDRGFLQATTYNDRGRVIVDSLIHMTKVLNLQTVAEGIETEEEVAFLKQVGCDIVQGYYYARPMPTINFEKLLNPDSTTI